MRHAICLVSRGLNNLLFIWYEQVDTMVGPCFSVIMRTFLRRILANLLIPPTMYSS